MAVRLPKNSVFIHTPKTGGTWVRSILKECGLFDGDVGRDHATPAELVDTAAWTMRPNFFCFVRHPLAWYQSYWAYRMKHGWHKHSPGELAAPIRTVVLDATCRSDVFERFVWNCLERYPQGWVSHLYQHYTSGCTFVGRQERLREDLLLALMIAGEDLTATTIAAIRGKDPINVASREATYAEQCQYPEWLRRRVLAAELHALELWGYR